MPSLKFHSLENLPTMVRNAFKEGTLKQDNIVGPMTLLRLTGSTLSNEPGPWWFEEVLILDALDQIMRTESNPAIQMRLLKRIIRHDIALPFGFKSELHYLYRLTIPKGRALLAWQGLAAPQRDDSFFMRDYLNEVPEEPVILKPAGGFAPVRKYKLSSEIKGKDRNNDHVIGDLFGEAYQYWIPDINPEFLHGPNPLRISNNRTPPQISGGGHA